MLNTEQIKEKELVKSAVFSRILRIIDNFAGTSFDDKDFIIFKEKLFGEIEVLLSQQLTKQRSEIIEEVEKFRNDKE